MQWKKNLKDRQDRQEFDWRPARACHPHCSWCFKAWVAYRKDREANMGRVMPGNKLSMTEAALTSVRPPDDRVPFNVQPGTKVRIAKGNQADATWAQRGVVKRNPGYVGLDGRHWLMVDFDGWECHVARSELALVTSTNSNNS